MMLKTLKRVFSYARPYKAYFFMTLLLAAIGVALSLSVPIFIGEAVDCCIGREDVDFTKLRRVAILLAGVVISSTLFQWLMSL